jgi:fumarate reductase flavoprotein subunit
MTSGLDRISEIRDDLQEVGVASDTLAFNLTWHDWLNLASLCDISEVIARAGLQRENSRGAHYREDHPGEGDLAASYFTVARQSVDQLEVSRERVDFSIVRPGGTILAEGEPETLVAAQ